MGIKFIDGNIFSRLSASKPTYKMKAGKAHGFNRGMIGRQ